MNECTCSDMPEGVACPVCRRIELPRNGQYPPPTGSQIMVQREDVALAHSLFSWLIHRGFCVTSEDDKDTIRLLERHWSKLLYGK